jgi:hypothetical protein
VHIERATANTIRGITVQGNTNYGIIIFGPPSSIETLVIDSFATGNGQTGIAGHTIVNSRADNNGGDGISGGIISDSEANNNGRGLAGNYVINSTAKGNGSIGILGGTEVLNSTALNNAGDGIFAYGKVANSEARNNGGVGIFFNACPATAVSNMTTNNAGGSIVAAEPSCLVVLDNNAP